MTSTPFYADLPARRARQICSDIFVLLWVVVWIELGTRIDSAVMTLAGPGREMSDAGRGLEDNLRSAGEKVDNIPLVGDDVRTPFDRASGAGAALRDAGESQIGRLEAAASAPRNHRERKSIAGPGFPLTCAKRPYRPAP